LGRYIVYDESKNLKQYGYLWYLGATLVACDWKSVNWVVVRPPFNTIFSIWLAREIEQRIKQLFLFDCYGLVLFLLF
jgi:hypothetical protein